MYRRSLALDAEDPDATLAIVRETATSQPLRDLAPGGLNELLLSLDVHASCFGMGNAATDGGVTACAQRVGFVAVREDKKAWHLPLQER